jgi:Tfp pilus assembly protein FimT
MLEPKIAKNWNAEDYRSKLLSGIQLARTEARELIQRAQQKQSWQYNKSHKHVKFPIGSLVWMYNPHVKKGKSRKLSHLWNGPFVITEKLSDVTYRLKLPNSRQHDIVHVNCLRPYIGPNDDMEIDTSDTSETQSQI